jgi:ketosteroid isomerase-like protein
MEERSDLLQLFDEDLAQMRAGNIDAMVEHYHPDAQVIRLPDVVAKGKDEIRKFYEDYLAMNPEVVEILSIMAADNNVTYHSTVKFGDNVLGIVGNWVLRDGLIWRQSAALVPAG